MFVTGRTLESFYVSPNAAEGENEAGVLVGPPAASPADWIKGAARDQRGAKSARRLAMHSKRTAAGNRNDRLQQCSTERTAVDSNRKANAKGSKHERGVWGMAVVIDKFNSTSVRYRLAITGHPRLPFWLEAEQPRTLEPLQR